MLSLKSVRTQLRLAQTRLSRLAAAPDRRHRRRSAQQWHDANKSVVGRAAQPEELSTHGFSLCPLDPVILGRLLEEWRTVKAQRSRSTNPAAEPRSTGKEFFEEMLSETDLHSFPSFLDAAIDEGVLASVTHALGMVPHLESIDVLASQHNADTLTSSQLWHYDVNDERIVKLFIYLEDCDARHGPFTFISADRSQQVAGSVGHYVQDDHIATHVPREQWRAVEGPAGTAFLIDTGRCYHFGSRSKLTRYAYVATYSSGLKFMKRAKIWSEIVGSRANELTPLQRMACGLER